MENSSLLKNKDGTDYMIQKPIHAYHLKNMQRSERWSWSPEGKLEEIGNQYFL